MENAFTEIDIKNLNLDDYDLTVIPPELPAELKKTLEEIEAAERAIFTRSAPELKFKREKFIKEAHLELRQFAEMRVNLLTKFYENQIITKILLTRKK